eukprot:5348752-Pleurochrysis_carterae.AAC.19
MDGVSCDVVLLDECSQMTEPASLLALARVGAQRLLCVGDPKQLPPTLVTRSKRSARGGGSSTASEADAGRVAARSGASHDAAQGLELTLFERLARCGLEPVELRQQARQAPGRGGG